MKENKKKVLSLQMVSYEFRNVIGNPYVHIFGIGLPIVLMIIISIAATADISYKTVATMVRTTIFLGIGPIIPMATVLMGYGVAHAQELEKDIPQRMELFGIRQKVSLCNRALSEGIFMILAFILYFAVGYLFMDIKVPKLSGILVYMACILALSIILFFLAHAISSLLKKFGRTYAVTMLIYFALMIFGGMMGISYDNMPSAMQVVAKLLPVTYINDGDFYSVWVGKSYNFMPMVQSYFFLAAIAGILLFISLKRSERKLH